MPSQTSYDPAIDICFKHYDVTVQCIGDDPFISRLDNNEIGLMNRIMHVEFKDQKPRISDLTSMAFYGEAGSIREHINTLVYVGLVTIMQDDQGEYLRVTDAARSFYQKLGQGFLDIRP